MSQRYIGGLIYNPPGGFSGYFDGTGDFVSAPSNAAFAVGSVFTMECWFYPSVQGGNLMMGTVGTAAPQIGWQNSTTFGLASVSTAWRLTSSTLPVLNTWNHVAVVRSGTGSNQTSIFLNGVRIANGTVTDAFTTTTGFTVGGASDATDSMTGYISNARLVKGTAVYDPAQTTISVPSGPLQAITNTSLLTCAYPTFRDGSANNFTITVNGNSAVSVQNPFPLTALPNPALGGAGNGVYTISQYQALRAQNLWPAFDPYWAYTTLMLHGNGTNGAQNNTFLDSSTNNFTITRNGNTTQGTFSPYGANWSNYFDGTGDYLTTPDNAALLLNGDFTVECWAYLTASTTFHGFVSSAGGVAGEIGFVVGNDGCQITDGSTVSNTCAFNAPLPLFSWHHIAFTCSGTSLRAFVNGIQQGSTVTKTLTVNKQLVQIGRRYPTATPYPMTGYLSNVRIIKGTALYTANFTPPTSPVTAITNTSLLTCQSNRFIDNSSNNFTITRNGDVSVQRFSPFSQNAAYSSSVNGGSGYFDGTGDYLTVPSNANLAFGTGDFTVEMFAYFNALPGGTNYANLFDMRDGNFNQVGLSVYVYGTTLGFDSGATVVNRTFTLTTGQWYHIVWSRVGTTYYTFVNGVQQGTGTLSTNYSTSYKTYVGSYDGTQSFFNGYLSSIRVLKGTGVSSVTVPTAPLTAVTNTQLLLNMTNGGIIDNAMMNDLETVGNAQVSTTQSKFGGASMYFDGSGDSINQPYNRNIDLISGDYTIEGWIYVNSFTATYTPVLNLSLLNVSTAADLQYWIGFNSTNKLQFSVYSASTGYSVTNANASTTGNWIHFACVRSGSTHTLYVNGTSVGTATLASNYTAASTFVFRIGSYQEGGVFYYLNGYIDDLRITKGVARYTTNFTPQTSQWQDQ